MPIKVEKQKVTIIRDADYWVAMGQLRNLLEYKLRRDGEWEEHHNRSPVRIDVDSDTEELYNLFHGMDAIYATFSIDDKKDICVYLDDFLTEQGLYPGNPINFTNSYSIPNYDHNKSGDFMFRSVDAVYYYNIFKCNDCDYLVHHNFRVHDGVSRDVKATFQLKVNTIFSPEKGFLKESIFSKWYNINLGKDGN